MNILITVGVNCVVLFFMYKFLNARLDRRIATGEVLDEIKREVGAIITELNETTDRNIELFETRVVQLKETIEQADRRLGLLKRENEKNSISGEFQSRIGSKSEKSTSESPDSERSGSHGDSLAHENTTKGQSATGNPASTPSVRYEQAARPHAKRGTDDPVRGAPTQPQSGGRVKPVRERPNRERILDFHRQGFASAVIAQKTGSTIGEVELVISLMQRRG